MTETRINGRIFRRRICWEELKKETGNWVPSWKGTHADPPRDPQDVRISLDQLVYLKRNGKRPEKKILHRSTQRGHRSTVFYSAAGDRERRKDSGTGRARRTTPNDWAEDLKSSGGVECRRHTSSLTGKRKKDTEGSTLPTPLFLREKRGSRGQTIMNSEGCFPITHHGAERDGWEFPNKAGERGEKELTPGNENRGPASAHCGQKN